MAANRNDDHNWVGDSNALIDRLRPVRPRYDIAIAVGLVSISVAAVLTAWLLQPPWYRFTMVGDGGVVYVLDSRSGDVAACKANGTEIVCTEEDSAVEAWMRRAEKTAE